MSSFQNCQYTGIGERMDTSPSKGTFWSMVVSNFCLSALSITNLGLLSSMVGFILHDKCRQVSMNETDRADSS